MGYTTEQVDAIAKYLHDLPPVKKKQYLSKQDMIRFLAKEIIALQKRGYTLEQISKTLTESGLSITTPTLRNYLQRSKPAKRKTLRKVPVKKIPATDPPKRNRIIKLFNRIKKQLTEKTA